MSGVGEVGDEHLETMPVDVGEGELRAGVARSSRRAIIRMPVAPRREVDEIGDLCDFGAVAFIAAIRADRRLPTTIRAR